MTDPRPIEANIEIDAPPREVWAVVSDLERMGEWSPQCLRMRVFGPVRLGARAVNLNRQGVPVWPSTAKVVPGTSRSERSPFASLRTARCGALSWGRRRRAHG